MPTVWRSHQRASGGEPRREHSLQGLCLWRLLRGTGNRMRDVSIAILAGGKSRRMGQNKSFVPLHGRPLIEHILDQLATLELPTCIVTNEPDAYVHYGLPLVTDVVPDQGALGGLYTALRWSPTPYVLC